MNKMIFEKVILDPADYFVIPEKLLSYVYFNDTQKRKILKAWELDITLLQVAEEENMCSTKGTRLLSRTHEALGQLLKI